MFRVLVTLTMLLLSVNASATAPQTRAASSLAGFIVHGPIFRYALIKDQNPAVCKHMLRVFNGKFTHPWDAPMLTSYTNDPSYSATSKYAFPLLPSVTRSIRATFEMRFSAWPTSPEFSAIHWKEGREVPYKCPKGETCSGLAPQPMLIAYFDFDNDGSVDTVMKYGGSFFQGYGDMSHAFEYLTVWRGEKLKLNGTPILWNLAHPRDKTFRPITIFGTYLRPFIYRGMTYVARYIPDFGTERPYPTYPVREDMLIERYYFAGRKVKTPEPGIPGYPEWSTETVCDLRMQRLNFR
jgi:hypothetical protein